MHTNETSGGFTPACQIPRNKTGTLIGINPLHCTRFTEWRRKLSWSINITTQNPPCLGMRLFLTAFPTQSPGSSDMLLKSPAPCPPAMHQVLSALQEDQGLIKLYAISFGHTLTTTLASWELIKIQASINPGGLQDNKLPGPFRVLPHNADSSGNPIKSMLQANNPSHGLCQQVISETCRKQQEPRATLKTKQAMSFHEVIAHFFR